MTIEKAIKLARKWTAGNVCTLREGEAQEYHQMCAEALEKSRWISVTERLPEVGVTVLTLDKHGHICDRYMYRCSDGTALFTAKHLVSSKDVTHWMPLPEAPKEEV